LHRSKKEAIMNSYDTNEIVRQAREMRAEEMRRIQGLMTARLVVYVRLLAGSLVDAGEALRPLFSWNPQNAKPGRRANGPSLLARASLSLRSLFSWNPQAH
jgi:hypothetical protein